MYKNIEVVNNKKQVLLRVKIDITDNMFLFIPEALDNRLSYLNSKILELRKNEITNYIDLDNHSKSIFKKSVEDKVRNLIYNEINGLIEKEGIKLYLVE